MPDEQDNWKHRSKGMKCATCMYFVFKALVSGNETEGVLASRIGRCRRHAPTMSGWPVMFDKDWCGDHKLDEEKLSA